MYQPECNLVYQYDASGAIIGFTYYPSSGTASQYFFGKNAQGDVLCIYDASGVLMAGYAYDAWGACTIAYDNTSIGIANINPIRYRSYYYDTETGWYYLQSRYYDPAVGRFISPDDPSLLGANGDLLSYNLYAYCSNNPVNYSDPSGHILVSAVITIIVATTSIGAVTGGYCAYLSGQDIWKGVAAGTLSGFVGGVLTVFAMTVELGPVAATMVTMGIRGVTSAIYNYANADFQGDSISEKEHKMFIVDIVSDMLLSGWNSQYFNPTTVGNISMSVTDAFVDVAQTYLSTSSAGRFLVKPSKTNNSPESLTLSLPFKWFPLYI